MFVDLVFLGDFCNLRCVYCSAGQTRWKRVGRALDGTRGGARVGVDLVALERDLFALLDRLALDAPFGVKISGGEIFVAPDLAHRVIARACERFPIVQVLTNGTRVDELLELLEAYDNLCVQVSIDGADPATNRARGATPTVWRNLARLAAVAAIEINTVLTRYNTRTLPDFLHRILSLGRSIAPDGPRRDGPGDIVVYPFPVRGGAYPEVHPATTAALGPFTIDETTRASLAPGPADWSGIDDVLARYPTFASVLPPRAYLVALRSFLRHGNRRGHCEIPRAITGVDQDGVQAVCPCGDLGVFGPIGDTLVRPKAPVWGEPCAGCFTHYEVLHHVDDVDAVRGPFTRALVEHARAFASRAS